jgi:hypothetical protein
LTLERLARTQAPSPKLRRHETPLPRRAAPFLLFQRTWTMPPAAGDAEAVADCEWLDDMVKKLKAELEAQLKRVCEGGRTKNGAPAKSTPAARAADARTLAVLERTLERLARMEQARAAVRETKVSQEGARDALERRLDKLAAAAETKPDS